MKVAGVVDVVGASQFAFDEAYSLALPEWGVRAVAAQDWRPLVEHVVTRCTDVVFAENRYDETFVESLTDSVGENAQALHDVLTGRLETADVPLTQRLRFAALEAEARIPHASLQRSYRISYFLQWQHWVGVIEQAALAEQVDPREAMQAMGSLTAAVHAYSDTVISNVAATFARSEDAFNRSRAHVRHRLVREILDGRDEALSPADLVTLDYSLQASHLAVLLPRTPQGAANQLTVGLRGAVRPTHLLVYPVGLRSSVVWLASATAWSEDRITRVVDVLEAAGAVAALSEPQSGLSGFVASFEQARNVEQVCAAVASTDGSGVVRYSQVRLEILLMQNRPLAAEFIREELGPLADDTAEAERLRATLEVSFRLGSHVATAEHLALHEHTVRNRLQRATELIGPLHERRTELQVALRLWHLVSTTSPATSSRSPAGEQPS